MLPLNRTSLIAVTSIALIGVTVVGLSRRGQSQDSSASLPGTQEVQSRSRQLSRLESDLAALKSRSLSSTQNDRLAAQLKTLEEEMARMNKALTTEARQASTAAETAPEASSMMDAVAEDERQSQQFTQFLEGSLANETTDSKWANAAAQEISGGLDEATMRSTQIGDVRCGTTLCRIEASHDTLEAEQRFIMQLGTLGTFQQSEGFAQRVQRDDGTVMTTMFLSRSGHRLPDPTKQQS
jgi:chromosome segregation ATPase